MVTAAMRGDDRTDTAVATVDTNGAAAATASTLEEIASFGDERSRAGRPFLPGRCRPPDLIVIVEGDASGRRGATSGAYGDDIYTEPDGDPDTLANLGPLRAMAGVWEGTGTDQHPAAEGIVRNTFVEHYELQPIDRQTNGPQLLYGLRYHIHVNKLDEPLTFHDQVGYWLWEPAARAVTLRRLASRVVKHSSRRDPPKPTGPSSNSPPPSAPRCTAFCRTRFSIRRSARSATGSK
jgi:nitrobindin-like protein